jgi:hypothetical protein
MIHSMYSADRHPFEKLLSLALCATTEDQNRPHERCRAPGLKIELRLPSS